MACSDGWQVAGRRKAASKRGKHVSNQNIVPQDSVCKVDEQKIRNAINELREEEFWVEWKDLLSKRLFSSLDASVKNCVCYGLGHFASCVSSRYQLAMLLLLLETLQIPAGNCCLYDPVFSRSECDVLKGLGFTVLTENEEGKREVNQPTLFYLMHCGKALYNNILWKNWMPDALEKIAIIGNSFYGIQDRMLQRELERDYSFLSTVIGACEETTLPCSTRFLDVFNDTALIRFPQSNLENLPESIWIEPSEPQYQHCQDLEIIQRHQQS